MFWQYFSQFFGFTPKSEVSKIYHVDQQFYIKRIDAADGAQAQAMEIAELLCDGFHDQPFMKYVLGEEFAFREVAFNNIFASEISVRKRLDLFVRQAELRRLLIVTDAKDWYVKLHLPDNVIYGLYDSKHSSGKDRLIGIVKMNRPERFVTFCPSWFTRFRLFIYKITTRVGIFFNFLGTSGMPYQNSRLIGIEEKTEKICGFIKDTPEVIDNLSKMSADELSQAEYPESYVWFCHIMVVSSRYRGKGLGYKLFHYALTQIPEADTPVFLSQDKAHSSIGQRRIHLMASEHGIPLYKKLGFTVRSSGRIELHKGDSMEDDACHTPMILDLNDLQ